MKKQMHYNDTEKIPIKVKIPKRNRPDKRLISDKVYAYRESTSQELREIGSESFHSVNESFHCKK